VFLVVLSRSPSLGQSVGSLLSLGQFKVTAQHSWYTGEVLGATAVCPGVEWLSLRALPHVCLTASLTTPSAAGSSKAGNAPGACSVRWLIWHVAAGGASGQLAVRSQRSTALDALLLVEWTSSLSTRLVDQYGAVWLIFLGRTLSSR
jgi:hypothetical protein